MLAVRSEFSKIWSQIESVLPIVLSTGEWDAIKPNQISINESTLNRLYLIYLRSYSRTMTRWTWTRQIGANLVDHHVRLMYTSLSLVHVNT